MALTQLQILERAQLLASSLAGAPAPVKKNVFLSVVADFMSDPHAGLDRLGRLLDLLEKGKGGHLQRGEGYGDQVRSVVQELGRFLGQNDDVAAEDWKSVFGWTARLLSVREAPGRDSRPTRPHHPEGPRRQETRPHTPPAKTLRVLLSGKNQDALKAFKDRLAKNDPEKSE